MLKSIACRLHRGASPCICGSRVAPEAASVGRTIAQPPAMLPASGRPLEERARARGRRTALHPDMRPPARHPGESPDGHPNDHRGRAAASPGRRRPAPSRPGLPEPPSMARPGLLPAAAGPLQRWPRGRPPAVRPQRSRSIPGPGPGRLDGGREPLRGRDPEGRRVQARLPAGPGGHDPLGQPTVAAAQRAADLPRLRHPVLPRHRPALRQPAGPA